MLVKFVKIFIIIDSKGTYNYFGILEIPGLKKQCA